MPNIQNKSAVIELSNMPFGTYCVRSCLTNGLPAGLSGELHTMVLSTGYREFTKARDAVLSYMDAVYKMHGTSVRISESAEPVITA